MMLSWGVFPGTGRKAELQETPNHYWRLPLTKEPATSLSWRPGCL